MKKILFFIILSEVLFALNIVVERNKNSILPYYLRLGSTESLLSISVKYDTLSHKISPSAKAHIYIRLYSKTKQKIKQIKNSEIKKTYEIKSKLGLKLRDKIPSVELKNSFKYTYKKLIFYEEVRIYAPFYYKESTTLEFNNQNKLFYITKTYEKDQDGINYSLGIDFYKIFTKFVKTVNFEINGNTQLKPIFYSYTFSTSYRFALFNKKYFYLNINPYVLISKQYNFKLKPAFSISINYDF